MPILSTVTIASASALAAWAPNRLAVPRQQGRGAHPLAAVVETRDAPQPLLTWGGGGPSEPDSQSCWSAWAGLSASYGWCLDDTELAEMQGFQDELLRESIYLGEAQMSRIRLAVEIAYQSRAWSANARSSKRLAVQVAN